MKDILIFPYNGNGLEAIGCLGKSFNFIGFVDDTPEKQGKHKQGFVVYSRKALSDFPDALVLAVPGSPSSYLTRKKIIEDLKIAKERFATVVHPHAQISPMARIGVNTLIMAGVVVTANSEIGSNVCVLPNTVIHHDTIIGDYSLLGSNVTVAGNTKIGELCYIGSGTSIINGISIGSKTLVGIGSNVIRSIPENVKAIGNPAKII